MVLLGGFAGLRFEEAAGLRREHLNLSRRSLRVVDTLKRGGSLGPPKTPTARRSVTLPHFLVAELANHLRNYPPGDNGLLFSAPEGGPISYPNWRQRSWLPAVRSTVGEPFGFHGLRHSHASILARQGVPFRTVPGRLGHQDPGVKLQVYTHLFDGADRAAADALDILGQAEGDAEGMQSKGQVLPLRPTQEGTP